MIKENISTFKKNYLSLSLIQISFILLILVLVFSSSFLVQKKLSTISFTGEIIPADIQNKITKGESLTPQEEVLMEGSIDKMASFFKLIITLSIISMLLLTSLNVFKEYLIYKKLFKKKSSWKRILFFGGSSLLTLILLIWIFSSAMLKSINFFWFWAFFILLLILNSFIQQMLPVLFFHKIKWNKKITSKKIGKSFVYWFSYTLSLIVLIFVWVLISSLFNYVWVPLAFFLSILGTLVIYSTVKNLFLISIYKVMSETK
ncbi:MAG: hypothetical protein PHU51_02780 [Candidatus Nanoarchaeia archaeon]|nr:hypothetical protein [Candidatus Nanoarchaeia archaeon]